MINPILLDNFFQIILILGGFSFGFTFAALISFVVDHLKRFKMRKVMNELLLNR